MFHVHTASAVLYWYNLCLGKVIGLNCTQTQKNLQKWTVPTENFGVASVVCLDDVLVPE